LFELVSVAPAPLETGALNETFVKETSTEAQPSPVLTGANVAFPRVSPVAAVVPHATTPPQLRLAARTPPNSRFRKLFIIF
jgi:hypothetical protein